MEVNCIGTYFVRSGATTFHTVFDHGRIVAMGSFVFHHTLSYTQIISPISNPILALRSFKLDGA